MHETDYDFGGERKAHRPDAPELPNTVCEGANSPQVVFEQIGVILAIALGSALAIGALMGALQ